MGKNTKLRNYRIAYYAIGFIMFPLILSSIGFMIDGYIGLRIGFCSGLVMSLIISVSFALHFLNGSIKKEKEIQEESEIKALMTQVVDQDKEIQALKSELNMKGRILVCAKDFRIPAFEVMNYRGDPRDLYNSYFERSLLEFCNKLIEEKLMIVKQIIDPIDDKGDHVHVIEIKIVKPKDYESGKNLQN